MFASSQPQDEVLNSRYGRCRCCGPLCSGFPAIWLGLSFGHVDELSHGKLGLSFGHVDELGYGKLGLSFGHVDELGHGKLSLCVRYGDGELGLFSSHVDELGVSVRYGDGEFGLSVRDGDLHVNLHGDEFG